MAPIACSVNVETARPIPPSAAIAAQTYSVTNSTRSSPSASDTVLPDSSVTGPRREQRHPGEQRDRRDDERDRTAQTASART